MSVEKYFISFRSCMDLNLFLNSPINCLSLVRWHRRCQGKNKQTDFFRGFRNGEGVEKREGERKCTSGLGGLEVDVFSDVDNQI